MIVSLTLAAHDTPLITRGPCQDTVYENCDPCIKLCDGEMLLSQLHSLVADQEPKKFSPMDSTPQDLTVPVFPAVAQAQDLMMSDFPDGAQAIPGHLVAAPVNADSVRNTMGDNLLTPLTAPTAFDRPPAALDPITVVTLLKSSAPNDHMPRTEMQLPYPLDEVVPPPSDLGNNAALSNPPSPSPMNDYDPGPALSDEEMLSPATQLHTFTAKDEDVSLCPLQAPAAGELKDLHLQELTDSYRNTMDGDIKRPHGELHKDHLFFEVIDSVGDTNGHCTYAALSQDTLPYNSEHPTHEIVSQHEPTLAQALPFHATQPCKTLPGSTSTI